MKFVKTGYKSHKIIRLYAKPVAYRLALPQELAKLHDVFHVSMLQRYRSDTLDILPVQDIQV